MSEAIEVPTSARRWRTAVEEYASERAKEIVSVRHKREMRRVLVRIGDELEPGGLACSPETFGDKQLNYLLSVEWARLSSRTKSYNICLLNGFLKARGNALIEKRRLHFPSERVRPTEAYTTDEAERILTAARNRGIVAYAIVALELTMGLRRSEVLRLKAGDFGARTVGFVNVLGKGKGGGKRREVPVSARVRELLPELLAHRQTVVEGREDPGFLLCHVWKGTVRAYGPANVDRFYVTPSFRDAGLLRPWQLNHALRRTFGKTLFDRGVPIEKIAALLGHEDTRTTLRYLGIGNDDKREAMTVIDEVFA